MEVLYTLDEDGVVPAERFAMSASGLRLHTYDSQQHDTAANQAMATILTRDAVMSFD